MRRLPLLLPERVLLECPLMLGLHYGPDGSPSIGAYFFARSTNRMQLSHAIRAVQPKQGPAPSNRYATLLSIVPCARRNTPSSQFA